MAEAIGSTNASQPVREAHRFDEAKLAHYLSENLQGFSGPLNVRQFAGGLSNPTYLLETPSRKYVLRRKPPGALLKSAHAVDREFRVMSALHKVGFPVPRPHFLCADESVIGTMFFVMEHIPGRVFIDCTMPTISREERAAIFDSVNETLARLHSVDLKETGLEDYGRPGNYFARQISRWSAQYQQSKTQDIPEMDNLMTWLPGAVPPESKPRLIHGDFSFHNVLIHPTEPRVVAVVDWELSTLGDPLGDLTYHAMEWYRPPGIDGRGTLRGADLNTLGVPAMEEYVQRYCDRMGFAPIGNLSFYRAYNLFRVAAIVQGVVARAAVGASANDPSEHAWRVRPLAVAAWEEAQKGGAA